MLDATGGSARLAVYSKASAVDRVRRVDNPRGDSWLPIELPVKSVSHMLEITPSFWSAIAATASAVTAMLAMRIQRRNLLESVRPELVLDRWTRTREPHDVIGVGVVRNVGKGVALN